MSLHQNEAGTQPAPIPRRPRRSVAPPMIVERVFEPDPQRCVEAVVRLLTPRSSTPSFAGSSSFVPNEKVVTAEER